MILEYNLDTWKDGEPIRSDKDPEMHHLTGGFIMKSSEQRDTHTHTQANAAG